MSREIFSNRNIPVFTIAAAFLVLFIVIGLGLAFPKVWKCAPGFDCGNLGDWVAGGATLLAVILGWQQYLHALAHAESIKSADIAERRASICTVLAGDVLAIHKHSSRIMSVLDPPLSIDLLNFLNSYESPELPALESSRQQIMELDVDAAVHFNMLLMVLRQSQPGMKMLGKKLASESQKNGNSVVGLERNKAASSAARSSARLLMEQIILVSGEILIELADRYPALKLPDHDEVVAVVTRLQKIESDDLAAAGERG